MELMKIPPAERGPQLPQHCGHDSELQVRVESLLRAAEGAQSFLQTRSHSGMTPIEYRKTDSPGDHIGEYELIEVLGKEDSGQFGEPNSTSH